MHIHDIPLRCIEVDGGCLEWQGALNSDGYPRGVVNGNRNSKLHRELFNYMNGYYPEVVRHTCDNIKCLNPFHLIGGSNLDNVNDRHVRNRTHRQVSELEIIFVKEARGLFGWTLKKIAQEMGTNYKRIEYINNRYVKEN